MIIQWTNKHSGEQGFVKKLNRESRYFENTFERSEAATVRKTDIKKTIALLEDYCPDNIYEAIER